MALNRKTPETRGTFVFYSLLAGVFWGTSFPIVKWGLDFISPVWFSALRLALAFICLLPLVSQKHIFLHFPFRYWLLGFFNALGFLLQFLGMQFTSASKASFYVNTNLIFVAVFSFLFLHERFGGRKIAGVILAVAGIYLLSIGLNSPAVLFTGKLKGDLLVLSAGVSWSIFVILNKTVLHSPKYSVLDTVSLFMLTSAVLMILVAPFLEPFPVHLSGKGLVVLLVSSSLALALPFYLWSLGLKGLTATVSSLLILVEIVVATLLSIVFLNERLDGAEMLGAAVLLVSMVLASLPEKERPPSHA